ncbi:MAG: glucosylceramidase [Bacteroidales bacterium]|nr:glucosylceramidase [Bacteroidales bacterium]
MKVSKIFFTGLVACLSACNCTTEKPDDGKTDTPGTPVTTPEKARDVTAYVTTADSRMQFEKTTFDFGKPGSMSPNQVTFDMTSLGEEKVDGFGLAVTTAAAYNLMQMSQEDRTAFLEETFSREKGAGMSLIRVAIGASDFCLKDNYTWCDTPGLENFAVHSEDKNYLFPVLKEIYAINPDVKIIGSPWSCPKWMKCQMPGGNSWDTSKFNVAVTDETTFDSWTGGRLKPSCYDEYAEYFVKWVQTMEKEGFDIHALTMQNEPLNPGNSMSLVMPWQDQKEFVKILGPAMEKAGLNDVQLLLFDHNYNYDGKEGQDNYPLNIYADPEAYKWADGSAWHAYGGNVTELDEIHTSYPEKSIYFTEASIGTWVGGYEDRWDFNFLSNCLVNDFSTTFLGTLKRGGSGVTLWNLMLDDKRGPFSPHDGSCKTCYGAVTINSADYKTIVKNSHWYDCAHASVALKPGARMMKHDSFSLPSGIELQMYLNPDKTVGVLICNNSSEDQSFVFSTNKHTVKYNVPAKSIASLIWQE